MVFGTKPLSLYFQTIDRDRDVFWKSNDFITEKKKDFDTVHDWDCVRFAEDIKFSESIILKNATSNRLL